MKSNEEIAKFFKAQIVCPLEEDKILGGKKYPTHHMRQCQCICQNGKKCEQQQQTQNNIF